GIVRDLRPRCRDDRQKRRLPRVRLSDEPDIGDELELELQRPPLSVLARLVLTWRLVRRRHEPGVALPASSGAGDEQLVAVRDHLAQSLSRVEIANHRSRRYRQDRVDTRRAGFVRTGAMIAILRLPTIAVRVIEQRAQIAVGADAHVTAPAAVAAVGTAHRHELLSAKGDDPRSAVTGFHTHYNAIDEHELAGKWSVVGVGPSTIS